LVLEQKKLLYENKKSEFFLSPTYFYIRTKKTIMIKFFFFCFKTNINNEKLIQKKNINNEKLFNLKLLNNEQLLHLHNLF
jgi:hypothetical protein